MRSIALTLRSVSSTLEAEILLAHTLKVSREALYAYPERLLTREEEDAWQIQFEKWQAGVPIAYLTGTREFWSLDLQITPATLIPRQETELLIELIVEYGKNQSNVTVADLGTGAGNIALALAKEKPHWTIYATDLSDEALAVAKENAQRLHCPQIIFKQGNWCHGLPNTLFDIIVSNPPYLTPDEWRTSPRGLTYEPEKALMSAPDGLSDLRQIIHEAPHYLKKGGLLLLEHGQNQAEKVRNFFSEVGYTDIITKFDLNGLERATLGSVAIR